jgi:D-tyrosyl-tRNA(Tyr) deacylase
VIGLLQRVRSAHVEIDGNRAGTIGAGLLVLVGVERGDSENEASRLLDRILGYRVFPDAEGKMNLNLSETGGGLMLVPQFTLAADTRKGLRPSFTPAAPPALGRQLFDYILEEARRRHDPVASGVFGADMRVALVNDGPVTFWLRTAGRESLERD